jgi:hypothetical protein
LKDQEWKRGAQDSVGLQCEFGSTGNVRFLPPEAVTAYDSRVNPVYCACGKPAGCGVIGKESSQMWCADCFPLSQYEAKMVYKKPEDSGVHNQILTDSWVRNVMKAGAENGDTDWYDPETITPRDGLPVYLKMEVTYKAWFTPSCKLSRWILENNQVPNGKIIAWQHREDETHYHEKPKGYEEID